MVLSIINVNNVVRLIIPMIYLKLLYNPGNFTQA